MRKVVLFSISVLIIGMIILMVREWFQVNYSDKFYIRNSNTKNEFIVYPDTTINSEVFKLHIEGLIEGNASVSALAVYAAKKGIPDSSYIVNFELKDELKVDTTLIVPYYGVRKGDAIIISYKPRSVRQVSLTIEAGSFGIPFEKLVSRLL